MGTINYGTCDYITMGIKPYEREDFLSDLDFMETATENIMEYGGDINEYIEDTIYSYYGDDRLNAKTIIDKYNFRYFLVYPEPGYYEGLYIHLSEEFPLFIDGEEERKEILEEVNSLHKMFIDLAGCGFVACFPGWCTGYLDYIGTLEEIEKACAKLREKAESIKTWEAVEIC